LLKIKNANQQHQQTAGRVVEVGTNTPAISHSDEWLWCRLSLRNHKFLKIDHAKKQTSQIDIAYPTSGNELTTSVASTKDSTMTTSSLNPDAPTFKSFAAATKL